MKLYLTIELESNDKTKGIISLWDWDSKRGISSDSGIDLEFELELTKEQIKQITDNGKIKITNVGE